MKVIGYGCAALVVVACSVGNWVAGRRGKLAYSLDIISGAAIAVLFVGAIS